MQVAEHEVVVVVVVCVCVCMCVWREGRGVKA